MSPLEFKLLSLSEAASKFVSKQGLPVPVFTGLPTWPEDTDFPVQQIPELDAHLFTQPDPIKRAISYRQRYDPDEMSRWTFVPNVDRNEVWLVRVARIDPSLN